MNTINKKRTNSQIRIQQAFVDTLQTQRLENVNVSALCKKAQVNRSTFYANYIDIFDLAEKTRDAILKDFASHFQDVEIVGFNYPSYILFFKIIREKQELYKAYFKMLGSPLSYFETHANTKKKKDYHGEFFAAGMSAIVQSWLNDGCKESPEDMAKIVENEKPK